jgi:oligopeptide transport system ATP-binding protein
MSYQLESTEAPQIAPDQEHAVRVRDLKKHYTVNRGFFGRNTDSVRAVDGVSFDIPTGKTFSLVGESGCGKTSAGKSILRIIEPTSGSIEVDGQDITELSGQGLKQYRKKMQMVYQDPTSSLNPRRTVRDIITEPMRIHKVGSKADRREKAAELLELVGLPPGDYLQRYPTSLSGGQKQRVGIARAVCLNPDFVVLDEPASALDVSVQARIVHLLNDLQDEFDLTYLFISHDLSLVKNVSDWIGIMYLGKLVEVGPVEEVFGDPRHPYTRVLLSSIPTITEDDERRKPSEAIPEGELPEPTEEIQGCPFKTRCQYAFDACDRREPPLSEVGNEHYARCLLHDDDVAEHRPEWV